MCVKHIGDITRGYTRKGIQRLSRVSKVILK
jgi:hypothetical protein